MPKNGSEDLAKPSVMLLLVPVGPAAPVGPDNAPSLTPISSICRYFQ